MGKSTVAFITAATLVLLAGGALAGENEMFIDSGVRAKAPLPVQAPSLATCMASPSEQTCAGVSLNDGGPQLESTAGDSDRLQLETFTLNLDTASVTTAAYSGAPKSAATKTKSVPSIAATIQFDYNSSNIRADQILKLAKLSDAIWDPVNKKSTFAVIGHTDGVGSDSYNCNLSTQRATQVVEALYAGKSGDKLIAIGAGKHLLKNAGVPDAAENRRVTFLRVDPDAIQLFAAISRLCQ